mmetsp:Transcript_21652/g.30338  ORF Transcript_21652/g.30338 Transcript_21652/m.30338 type:complete len:370 (+) Transcript_21652:86-1195(+)|eukprot:CAMPEP_0184863014 /NCGR_PEP_ID=MMETSP0580-20130426/8290_1 /TAXON_ID=1118495 /ORGANISM="Dactyliosolen fragilissimus" /LENGTH=369 /DNA_ID=CAMNT_0027361055 /DNA_START=41 /DNA_END=1150 /DNA_ORIENTATION=-
MIARFALFSAFLAGVSALTKDITSSSRVGGKIISKARKLNDAQEEENDWMVDYSIKFHQCFTVDQYDMEGANRDEGGAPFAPQHLVHFKLCPTNSCKSGYSSCSGGADYVVEMRDFVEAFTEAENEEKEYKCEQVRENCNCDYYNGDDEACESKCFAEAGLDYCVEDEDEEEFNVEEYMECREAEFGNNNNNNGALYYIGPMCGANGKAIFLQMFSDANCMTEVNNGIYGDYNYGKTLPYSNGYESLVDHHCRSCKEPKDEEEYYNQGDDVQDEVLDMCEELYEPAGKCEVKLAAKYYKDENSCTYIKNVLPALSGVHRKQGSTSTVPTVFAWLFFISTCALGGLSYFLYQKVERSNVKLSDSKEGTLA